MVTNGDRKTNHFELNLRGRGRANGETVPTRTHTTTHEPTPCNLRTYTYTTACGAVAYGIRIRAGAVGRSNTLRDIIMVGHNHRDAQLAARPTEDPTFLNGKREARRRDDPVKSPPVKRRRGWRPRRRVS